MHSAAAARGVPAAAVLPALLGMAGAQAEEEAHVAEWHPRSAAMQARATVLRRCAKYGREAPRLPP